MLAIVLRKNQRLLLSLEKSSDLLIYEEQMALASTKFGTSNVVFLSDTYHFKFISSCFPST